MRVMALREPWGVKMFQRGKYNARYARSEMVLKTHTIPLFSIVKKKIEFRPSAV